MIIILSIIGIVTLILIIMISSKEYYEHKLEDMNCDFRLEEYSIIKGLLKYFDIKKKWEIIDEKE